MTLDFLANTPAMFAASVGLCAAGLAALGAGVALMRHYRWHAIESCPRKTPVIVAVRARMYVGGDGRPIYWPQQCRVAWLGNDGLWTDFTNGLPILVTPDLWRPLPAIPPADVDELIGQPVDSGAVGL